MLTHCLADASEGRKALAYHIAPSKCDRQGHPEDKRRASARRKRIAAVTGVGVGADSESQGAMAPAPHCPSLSRPVSTSLLVPQLCHGPCPVHLVVDALSRVVVEAYSSWIIDKYLLSTQTAGDWGLTVSSSFRLSSLSPPSSLPSSSFRRLPCYLCRIAVGLDGPNRVLKWTATQF